VRTRVIGEPLSGGVLYVANHISWMDIPMMGARLPNASFVAKSEVGEMPGVGFLADLQRTIYVERERRHHAVAQADSIAARLRAGDNVILFPEGTSNDGIHLLPFKSTLFAVLDAADCDSIPIQPLSIAYTRINGMPMTRNRLIEISWIGDLELAPHAAEFLRMGRFEARVLCHPPVWRRDFSDRKALARHCEQQVARGYRELVRGHA
jgi:1-acyl-sn-glycerol-3-phosphate acyltransferase